MRRCLVMVLALSASTTALAQGRRIEIEEFNVVGKIQKPEITMVVSRQNVDTQTSLNLQESFIPKVVESIEKKPF
jgi:hypothetical protein